MMPPQLTLMILSTALLAASPLMVAQDLTLFESVVDEQPSGNGPEALQNRLQGNIPAVPAFTLLGTTRIGNKYTAVLLSNSGEVVVVQGRPGEMREVPDHPGYRVLDIGSRRISIAGLGNIPCIAATDKGVACGDNGVSFLSLTTAATPLAVSPAAVTGAFDPAAAAPESEVPDNPFAAALRAAAENEASARGDAGMVNNAERFQPRRIPPEDIPAGMRVVRTPFGDRLVEQ